HRFGASLNTHFHFPVVVLDGVFSHASDGEVRFHEAGLLQSDHWHELQHVVQSRVLRYFHRHDLLDEVDAHGMLSWQGSGGFSIDASVHIEGDDRAGVERLLRYCARPPFALERLYAPGGIVSLSSGHPPEVGRQARLSAAQAGARRPHRAPALSASAPRAARDHASRGALIPPGTDAKRWSRPSSSISRRPRGQACKNKWCSKLYG
ncbi:MAG: transposase, partial [candidate division Zixibacteria bacterium]|nr:transposase [candidate division Zixibacteria bacterium]